MKQNKFRIYSIVLSDISTEGDLKFAKLIKEKKFEWWRYTALNWFLITPTTVSTNDILRFLVETYGVTDSCFVFEIYINDFGGLLRSPNTSNEGSEINPFVFFQRLKEPDFVPIWEKKSEDTNSA